MTWSFKLTVSTIFLGSSKLIGTKEKLRSLVFVESLACMIEIGKITGWHFSDMFTK